MANAVNFINVFFGAVLGFWFKTFFGDFIAIADRLTIVLAFLAFLFTFSLLAFGLHQSSDVDSTTMVGMAFEKMKFIFLSFLSFVCLIGIAAYAFPQLVLDETLGMLTYTWYVIQLIVYILLTAPRG